MKKIAVLLSLFFVMMFGVTVRCCAANVCYDIRGDLTKTVTFKVNVGKKIFSSEKIVLTQTKGNTKQTFYNKTKNVGMYGRFYISVYDETDRRWVYNNSYWKSKNFTIKSSKLKKKHSYTITVRGDSEQYVGDSYSYTPYVFNKWYSYPTWKATKTGGNISFCGY